MEVPSIYLNKILSQAAKKNASNLHLLVGNKPFIRIDGELKELENETILNKEFVENIIKNLIPEKDYNTFSQNKKYILVKSFTNNLRFRISIYYQRNLPSLSFNFIPSLIKNISELGLPEILKDFTNYRSGLFIIAGPNDSGKTSTAASLLEYINHNKKKYIITLEDPIEYLFLNNKSIVEQRQINEDTKSYSHGIDHCLEEDVDVVYIDEMKNEFETVMPSLLQLASGNSLVFLELNADNSIRAIERVLNTANNKSIESVRHNLADILLGIITQKLIPKRGGGLVLAYELLIGSSPVKALIREGKINQIESIIQTSRQEGMISMERSVQALIKSGDVKEEDI